MFRIEVRSDSQSLSDSIIYLIRINIKDTKASSEFDEGRFTYSVKTKFFERDNYAIGKM